MAAAGRVRGAGAPGGGEALGGAALRGQAARELSEATGGDFSPDELRLWTVARGEIGSLGLTYLAPARPEVELHERFAAVTAELAEGASPNLDGLALVRSPA
ncbi:hypothetical protein [Streptomyces sp. NPDC048349]|uniref:hypothetical protein n=1 Tax=Streptomyces sp. NPDC048349 TaxID=3155486 RepID=UPI00342013DA